MKKSDLQKSNLPDMPGVYLFKHGRKVLYVGKATSLRDRVRSYFDDELILTRGPRVVDMVTRADRITFETTPTVLEALVREATLIKKYSSVVNVEGKDDKTFLHVVITREDIPRVLVVRGKDIDFKTRRLKSDFNTSFQKSDFHFRAIYGPFPSGAQLREGLRIIRRIFPFFDTAKPVGTKSKHQAAQREFNVQIKQSPRNFNAKEYRCTIRHIMLFLSGRGKELRMTLEKDMRHAAKEERFEDAIKARRQLSAFDHIQDVSLIKDENLEQNPSTNSGQFASQRIEAYDTAHLSGTNAIGVMIVVENSTPAKSAYRIFRIRGPKKHVGRTTSCIQNDDIASLKEILSRRLGHPEWPLPKAIVVDGGTAHKKAAESVLKEVGVAISVVAVVKDGRHRPREIIGTRRAGIDETDVVLANAEAHRFSLARHRHARSRLVY